MYGFGGAEGRSWESPECVGMGRLPARRPLIPFPDPEASLEARDTLPPLPGPIPAGLPSELLLRRPDRGLPLAFGVGVKDKNDPQMGKYIQALDAFITVKRRSHFKGGPGGGCQPGLPGNTELFSKT